MKPENAEPLDDQLSSLLLAYDEALATGRSGGATGATTIPSELLAELEAARTCLDRLEADRRRSGPSPCVDPGPASHHPRAFADSTGAGRLGRFRLVRELGRGGHGIVFLAYDPFLRREVALKIPRPEIVVTPELSRRFLTEAQTAAGLAHPNLVPVHEAGEVGPICYIVSAYCPGPTLRTWLAERGELADPRQAADLIARLADAVAYMHSRGILHRDIKPGNILLEDVVSSQQPVASRKTEGASSSIDYCPRTADYSPKLTDFGLAKFTAHDGTGTRTGVVLGTVGYMAPEQAEGRVREVGPASDVYGLGAVLYELLTGRPPFRGATDADTLRQVLHDEPIRPGRLRADLPRDLQTICLECLQKEPARRYASAGELAADLRCFLSGVPIRARPAGPLRRARVWARRRPAAAGLLLVSVLALLVLGAGTAWHAVQVSRYAGELEDLNANLRATSVREREQRLRAEEREALLRRMLYAHQFRLARQAWEKGEVVQAVEWLDALRPGPGQEDLRGFEWYYLKELCHPLRAVWRGHQGGIEAVAVSPDGSTVASGGGDRTVRLWDLATGQTRAVLAGHTQGVVALTFSPDGRALASRSLADAEVSVWDAETGRERARLGPGAGPGPVHFTPDGERLVVAERNGVASLDAMTGQPAKPFLHQPAPPLSLAVTPDGRTLATGDVRGTVRLWDLATARERFVLPGHRHAVWCLALTPDGRTLATGSLDKMVKLWDVATGDLRATLGPHREEVFAVAFAPDGRTLATAAHPWDRRSSNKLGEVQLWDLAGGAPATGVEVFAGQVDALAFASHGRLLVLGCSDKTVKVLDTGPRPGVDRLAGHAPQETWGLAFAPDGRTLASAGDDHRVKLWDPETGRLRAVLEGHGALVSAVGFSPDGRTLASVSYDHTLKLWEAGSGRLRATLEGAEGNLRCVAFSPDGRLLAAGGCDHKVRLWELPTGRGLACLGGHRNNVRAVAFAPDGRTLASSGEGGRIQLWDTSTWQPRHSIDDTDEVGCLAFSPDGKTLAAGDRAGVVKLWDAATGKERLSLKGHVGEVYALAFSPDGRTVAAGGDDKTVRLWQAATGEELLVLKDHATRVNAVAFAPNGKTLASASHDGAVKLWRAVFSEPDLARSTPSGGRPPVSDASQKR